MARTMGSRLSWAAALSTLTALAGCGSSIIPADAGVDHRVGSDSGRDGQTTGSGGRGGDAGGTCTATTGCRNGMVCNTANGRCVECLTAADCGTQKCELATHTCVDCLSSADCPANMPNCSGGHTCGGRCTTNANCPQSLPACETSTKTCVECLTGADCGPGGICQPDLTCG